MNEQKLNLLILEDNPDDAELMVRELEKEGFVFEWKRVDTEKAFKEALSEKPDIILSDYKLPSFDGMAAIKLHRKIAPDIPLIVVSDTIGEELTVECLKAGAMDYICKDRLSRLGHSVKRTLKEAEKHNKLKQAELILIESEKKYRQLAETAKDAIMVLDLKGNVKYANQESINLCGYTEEEILKMNVNDILSADNIPISDNNFAKLIAGDKSLFMYEIVFVTKKGDNIPVEIKSSLITEQGKPSGVLIIVRDITERKQAEEKLKRNFQQQKLLTEISYLFTKLGKFNENMKETLCLIGEYTKVSRVYVFEDFNNGEFTKNTYEWCNKNIEPQIDKLQEIPYSIIPSWKKILNEKGMVFSTNILELPQDLIDILEPQKIKSILVLPIYVKAQFFGFMGFEDCENHRIWDNSEIDLLKTVANIISTLFERNQAEKKLQESEETFRSITATAQDSIVMMNNDGNFSYWNEAAQNMFGFTKEEVIGKEVHKLIAPPEYYDDFRKGFEIFRKTGEGNAIGRTIELMGIRKNGTKFPVELSLSPVKLKDKWNAAAIIRDITKRKQAEKKLKKTNEELSAFNRLAVGRELKMIELKREINELLKKLGQKGKYKIVE